MKTEVNQTQDQKGRLFRVCFDDAAFFEPFLIDRLYGAYETAMISLQIIGGCSLGRPKDQVVDELEKGGANAMTSLNAMLANNKFTFPNGETIDKHENFNCIACGNTYGRGASRQYVGANELDASTLDRFDVLEWDVDDKLEMDIATDKEWCQLVQACREAVRSFEGTIQLIVSMRATLRGEKLLAAGFEHREVFEMLVYKGLDANSKEKVAEKSAEIMASRVA